MKGRKRRDGQVFRRLDPELAAAGARWAEAMRYIRELTTEAADGAAEAYVREHPSTPLEDAKGVFRGAARHAIERMIAPNEALVRAARGSDPREADPVEGDTAACLKCGGAAEVIEGRWIHVDEREGQTAETKAIDAEHAPEPEGS